MSGRPTTFASGVASRPTHLNRWLREADRQVAALAQRERVLDAAVREAVFASGVVCYVGDWTVGRGQWVPGQRPLRLIRAAFARLMAEEGGR